MSEMAAIPAEFCAPQRKSLSANSDHFAIAKCSLDSLDDFVSTCEHHWRDIETDRLGGHKIDDQLDLRGLLDRQVGRLFSLEDAADINAGEAARFETVGSKTHQATSVRKVACLVDRGYGMANGQRNQLSQAKRKECVSLDRETFGVLSHEVSKR